jgi:hypothetical protein
MGGDAAGMKRVIPDDWSPLVSWQSVSVHSRTDYSMSEKSSASAGGAIFVSWS